jgi:hypothetical protein
MVTGKYNCPLPHGGIHYLSCTGFYNGVTQEDVGGKCSGRDLGLTCEGLLVAGSLKNEVKRSVSLKEQEIRNSLKVG